MKTKIQTKAQKNLSEISQEFKTKTIKGLKLEFENKAQEHNLNGEVV